MPRSLYLAAPLSIICVVCIALTALGEMRTWTDVSGKHTIEAELVSLAGDKVKLRREDGQEITLPLARLSEDDRAYLKLLAATRSPAATRSSAAKSNAAAKPAASESEIKALRDVADRFYRDLRSKERNDARSLLTEAAQKYAADKNSPLLKIATPDDGARSIRIGRAKFSDSQAEVPVQVQVQNVRHETTLHLR